MLPEGWTPQRLLERVRSRDWEALARLAPSLRDAAGRLDGRPCPFGAGSGRRARSPGYAPRAGAAASAWRCWGPTGREIDPGRGLRQSFVLPARQVYMGLTGGWLRHVDRLRVPGIVRVGRFLVIWGRYLRGQYHLHRGRLVVFDRYIYDAEVPTPYPLSRWGRLARWLDGRTCPGPDLVLILDAPGAVMHERKGEYTPEVLEDWRQKFLTVRDRHPNVVVLDTTRPVEDVRAEAVAPDLAVVCGAVGPPVSGCPGLLELLHPDGRAARIRLLGSGCPDRLRPEVGDAGPPWDLMIVAPSAAEISSGPWVADTTALIAASLDRDGLAYILGSAGHRRRIGGALAASGVTGVEWMLHLPSFESSTLLLRLEGERCGTRWTTMLAPGSGRHRALRLMAATPGVPRGVAAVHPSVALVARRPGARPLARWLGTETDAPTTVSLLRVRWRRIVPARWYTSTPSVGSGREGHPAIRRSGG